MMDTIVKAGCLYGLEVWGWKRWEEVERIQNKFVKMALGVNRNTPDYIWKMEAGRCSLEIETRRRAGNYLLEILKMGEERWPRICLMEEIRNIKNGYPSEWGRKLEKAFREVGDGEGLTWIQENRAFREEGRKIKLDQEIQRNWNKIEKSNYCKGYKEWKIELGREGYWQDKSWDGETKEQWARLRCGCLGKSKEKGFEDVKCRLCGAEKESLEHIWVCLKAKEGMQKEWVDEIEELGLWGDEDNIREKMISILKGEPRIGLCRYSRRFEE